MPPANRHQPARSWTIAIVYFAMCWLIAVATGAWTLFETPLGRDAVGRPGFWALWLVVLVSAYVGYWVIWPMGTHTADRPRRPVVGVLFGAAHGVSEGMLYGAFWWVIDQRDVGRAWTIFLTLGAVAAFNGAWRTLVWDVWVTPPHNIDAWNVRKVAFVHLPVLTLSVMHLTTYRSVVVFLSAQIVALVGAAIYMRLPSPLSERGALT